MTLLSDLKVAILADDGVNQAELAGPREALEKAGVSVYVISLQPMEVKAWTSDEWGVRIKVDRSLKDISPDEFEGLIIPGGRVHVENLQTSNSAVNVVWRFFSSGKVVAAISHGIQMLISAGIIQGRHVTSGPSYEAEVISSGGYWRDQDVICDNGLITCRGENDLTHFNECFLEELRQGIHQKTVTVI